MNDKIVNMLVVAYSMGYEHGHHDTVEGVFSGDGTDQAHDPMAKEIVDEGIWNGCFRRELNL